MKGNRDTGACSPDSRPVATRDLAAMAKVPGSARLTSVVVLMTDLQCVEKAVTVRIYGQIGGETRKVVQNLPIRRLG
jgi:hypothetical protein